MFFILYFCKLLNLAVDKVVFTNKTNGNKTDHLLKDFGLLFLGIDCINKEYYIELNKQNLWFIQSYRAIMPLLLEIENDIGKFNN